MRPRLITAENSRSGRAIASSIRGFNEAAAHHRGEPERRRDTRP